MENTVNASSAASSGQIVVAGAGYAGLHVALRLTARLRNHAKTELTLVDRRALSLYSAGDAERVWEAVRNALTAAAAAADSG